MLCNCVSMKYPGQANSERQKGGYGGCHRLGGDEGEYPWLLLDTGFLFGVMVSPEIRQ